ncbi:hypothetical protein TELCIR_01789 [Teladorsagia circumcincta]|uniref:Uncharacterized protein n=1 Tax=Teladorsagia circumcincta TaxID=45464 RepID=A0A2G9V0X2_TELCI|nr:hypothetical protein TELCIR_01789 [Teladorsagia circumcincta]
MRTGWVHLSFVKAADFIAQSSDPLEGGKKIPLLVEFLILNASEVMPPGFNSDNIFSILNSVDHNANHLCSPEPTCSDDEGSQRTPIIEEVEGEPSPSLNDLRDEVTPDLPPRFLEVIHENEGVLSFSDSDDEVELIRRPLSRASFRSETLRQQNDDTLKKEELLPEKSIPSQLVDERKQPDTPRSPCLKRIHFQRKQEQVQQRSSELFKFDVRHEAKPDRLKEEKCVNNSAGTTRKDPVVIESSLRATTKEGIRSEEPQKPTVHVHPFTPDIPSQEPILRTITERLQSLRDNQLDVDSSPRLSRRSFLAPDEPIRFRDSYIDTAESPRLSKKFYEPDPSPMNSRRFVENRVSHEDLYSPLYKPQEFPYRSEPPYKHFEPQIITERFSSYCIEPPVDEQLRKESTIKRVEIGRSGSHRSDKAPPVLQKDIQRAASVKSGRRADACVGMDSLEINWSVRQLKTLFQDKRAPSINTDYTIS